MCSIGVLREKNKIEQLKTLTVISFINKINNSIIDMSESDTKDILEFIGLGLTPKCITSIAKYKDWNEPKTRSKIKTLLKNRLIEEFKGYYFQGKTKFYVPNARYQYERENDRLKKENSKLKEENKELKKQIKNLILDRD